MKTIEYVYQITFTVAVRINPDDEWEDPREQAWQWLEDMSLADLRDNGVINLVEEVTA
jgi:hypothetical protein